MDNAWAAVTIERRQQADRRAHPTFFWGALRFHGRRKGFRRAGEGGNAYVDCPSRGVAWLLFAVIISSVLDALFTLVFLGGGGDEANPVMALVLSHGHTPFVGLKMALTGLGAWFLAAHQNFPLAFKALRVLAFGYLGLLLIHATILLS
jgi:Domain of unknown function (DUF5658)